MMARSTLLTGVICVLSFGTLCCLPTFAQDAGSDRSVTTGTDRAAVLAAPSLPWKYISLTLGGRLVASAIPAVVDSSGEVYAPALDSINAAFGSSLSYQADRDLVSGAAADRTPVSLAVSQSAADAQKTHISFVVNGQVFVPLRMLARLMGDSFEWNAASQQVALMPRLASISVVPMDQAMRIELHSSAPLGFVRVSYYDSPWRIVLDVNGARAYPGRQICTEPGLAEVRWKEWPSPGHVRIVAELRDRLPFVIADSGHSTDYWLDIGRRATQPLSGQPGTLMASAPGRSDNTTSTSVDANSGQPANPGVFRPAAPAVAPAPSRSPASTTSQGASSQNNSGNILPPAPVSVVPVQNSQTPGVTKSGSGVADSDIAAPPAPTNSGPAAEIKDIATRRVDGHTTEVTISADRPVACHPAFYDSPSRLVLDVPNANLKLLSPDLNPGSPGVKEVRSGNFPKGTANARIVVDLTSRSEFRVWSEQDRSLIRIMIREMQPDQTGHPAGSVLAGRVICIDPGHCDTFHGCRGYGMKEEEVSLDVARRLELLLTAAGARVVMTRTTMAAPSGGGYGLTADLIKRASIGNEAHADLFLSIHCNATWPHGSGHGSQVIYGHQRSYKWAQYVYRAVLDAMQHGGEGLHYRPLIKVTEYSEMPAALAELGYLDNKWDADLLAESSFRQKEAESLFHAFEAYFGANGSAAPRPDFPDEPDNGGEVIPIPSPTLPDVGQVAAAQPGDAGQNSHGGATME